MREGGSSSYSLQRLLSSSSSFSPSCSVASLQHNYYKRPTNPNRALTKAQASSIEQILVCTNRTCRKQGSIQTLHNLTDLSPPNVVVKSCGCLGRCGSGPNVAVLPQGTIVAHCGTASQAARLLFGPDLVGKTLEALALRKRAEAEIELAHYAQAQLFLSQAIELEPAGGIHMLFRLRSSASLALGDNVGALEDARKAMELSPNYVEARISEGDALMAMDQYDAADNSYAYCLQIDPSIRRSKSFKARVARLQQKLAAATTCQD